MRGLFTVMLLALNCLALLGQTTNKVAPGAPGNDAHWPSAAKNGFGTANTLASKVWFTLQGGVLTEVFYPRLDIPNTQTLQMIVCTRGVCHAESDTVHQLRVLDSRSLSFRQINTALSEAYTITKTYTSDSQRPTVLIDVSFTARDPGAYEVYVYYDPSLNNSGLHDKAWSSGDALLASDQDVASALISKPHFQELNNGYLGTSDGLSQLRQAGRITDRYQRADNGNVVQVARIREPTAFTLALGFGKNAVEALNNARASLRKGFSRSRREYEFAWHTYVSSLPAPNPKYRRQFNMAAMVLKALEDKTYRGAMIASPSIPWGGGPNANEPVISGIMEFGPATFIMWPLPFWPWVTARAPIARLIIYSRCNKSRTAVSPKTPGLTGDRLAVACRWTRSHFLSSLPINFAAPIEKRG